jgi:hypothetical protein
MTQKGGAIVNKYGARALFHSSLITNLVVKAVGHSVVLLNPLPHPCVRHCVLRIRRITPREWKDVAYVEKIFTVHVIFWTLFFYY